MKVTKSKKYRVTKVVDSIEAAKGYSSKINDYFPKKPTTKLPKNNETTKLEPVVVQECHKWFKNNKWIFYTIWTGGVPIGFGKLAPNPAKGIPDCVAFHPETKRMVWIEFKRSSGGIVSSEQESWHKLLKHSNQEIYVINSVKLLEEVLTK